MIHSLVMTTPVGPLALLERDGALVGAGFRDPGELVARLHASMRDEPVAPVDDLGELSAAMAAYFEGDLGALDSLPVHQPGTPLRERLWAEMRAIKPGETRSYAELAEAVGIPRGARAAGGACAGNLVAPIVPCHRVVATDGSLNGYAYGLHVKHWLLTHESPPKTI